MLGILLITLPAISLPSAVMVGRALTWRAVGVAAAGAASAGRPADRPVPTPGGYAPAVPTARFFFDAGSGTLLWAAPEDQAEWGYPVDLDRLPVGPELRAALVELVDRYDTSLNWDYPPDPGPWSDAENERFNADVRRVLARLRAELGTAWKIVDEFIELPAG